MSGTLRRFRARLYAGSEMEAGARVRCLVLVRRAAKESGDAVSFECDFWFLILLKRPTYMFIEKN